MTEQVSVEVSLRDNGINRLGCKSEKIVLTSDNIDRFVILKNRRDIRRGAVNRLRGLLEKGQNPDSPIVTNRVTRGGVTKDVLLDGNHRITAIEEFLNEYPNRKVEVFIMYYENLDPDEEKRKYTQWNSGTKQNTNDFVKQYWEDIQIAKRMERDFPCKVAYKWGKDCIEFKTLVAGYLTKDVAQFAGGFGGSAIEFIERVKALGNEDYAILKAYMQDYIGAYGKPDMKANIHYKQANFYALFRIWLDNREKVPMTEMKKAFLKVKNGATVEHFAKGGGTRENCQLCHTQLLANINAGRTRNIFS